MHEPDAVILPLARELQERANLEPTTRAQLLELVEAWRADRHHRHAGGGGRPVNGPPRSTLRERAAGWVGGTRPIGLSADTDGVPQWKSVIGWLVLEAGASAS